MNRVHRPSALLATLLAVAAIAAGCGSGGKNETAKEPPGTTAPIGQKAPPLAAADRRAYRRLSAASGALRAAAAPLGAGSAGAGIAGKRLRAQQRRVAATSPRAPALRSVRTRLLAALAATLAARPGPAAAQAALAAADRADTGLRDYAAAHPAANELSPR